MKIKLNKQESKIIDDVDFAIYWLIEAEGYEDKRWLTIRRKFKKLLREKFILTEEDKNE
jgi:hypothetical protein